MERLINEENVKESHSSVISMRVNHNVRLIQRLCKVHPETLIHPETLRMKGRPRPEVSAMRWWYVILNRQQGPPCARIGLYFLSRKNVSSEARLNFFFLFCFPNIPLGAQSRCKRNIYSASRAVRIMNERNANSSTGLSSPVLVNQLSLDKSRDSRASRDSCESPNAWESPGLKWQPRGGESESIV